MTTLHLDGEMSANQSEIGVGEKCVGMIFQHFSQDLPHIKYINKRHPIEIRWHNSVDNNVDLYFFVKFDDIFSSIGATKKLFELIP